MPIIAIILSWCLILAIVEIVKIIDKSITIIGGLKENFMLVLLVITLLFSLLAIIAELIKQYKYKNETPKERKKRKELEKIKE